MWECGLKPSVYGLVGVCIGVTPYVGVWIETHCKFCRFKARCVTPYVGVWIETEISPIASKRPTTSLLMWECGLKHTKSCYYSRLCDVTPYVGVWIETSRMRRAVTTTRVTPYVGVWIET